MKFFCLLIFALAFPAAEVFSQSPAGYWIKVSDPNEEFDFEMPITDYTKSSAASGVDINYYSSESDGTKMYLSSTSEVAFVPFQEFLRFAGQFDPLCSKGDLGEVPFYTCSYDESRYFYHAFKVIPTEKRIYTLYAYSTRPLGTDANRFFESVSQERTLATDTQIDRLKIASMWEAFNKKRTSRSNTPEHPGLDSGAKELNKIPKTTEGKAPGKSSSSKSGIGSGSGIGAGQGPGSVTKPGDAVEPDKSQSRSRLQILSKPRPVYTDLARHFRIQGEVKLRVTFKSDATIGSVDVLSALPFGLTDSAIRAARSINFVPVKTNDRAVSVKKRVNFHFTIY